MGVLKSRLFTNADPETNAKLEACATGNPNEWSTHFTIGAKGDHIRRLQRALRTYRSAKHLEKEIRDFPVDGSYSKEFAEAVGQYKKLRDIKNYAGKIDEIIGIQTIQSLDKEAAKDDVLPPVPRPPPDPSFKSSRITRRVFTSSTSQDLRQSDDPLDVNSIIQGLSNLDKRLTDPISLLGDESLSERRVAFLADDLGVNIVDQKITTKIEINNAIISSVTTTELTYTYGEPNQNVVYKSTFHGEGGGLNRDEQKTVFVPREVARKSLLLTPPRP